MVGPITGHFRGQEVNRFYSLPWDLTRRAKRRQGQEAGKAAEAAALFAISIMTMGQSTFWNSSRTRLFLKEQRKNIKVDPR